MVKKILILAFTLVICRCGLCQEEDLTLTITDIAEQLAADESDTEEAASFIDLLTELSENPVRINSGEESEIRRLFFLSDFQIRTLCDHIKKSGNIVSVYEIASIPGFDRQGTEIMMPFISLTAVNSYNPYKSKLRNNLITSLLTKPGENDTASEGSQWKILSKYKVSMGPFSAGLTIEKDPGEQFFAGTPPVPDFFSSYVSWAGKGFLKQVIMGDYSAHFGLGTNINTRSRTGISLIPPVFLTGADALRPYTASDENNFFRGIAAELSFRKLDLSMLYSQNKLDATIVSSPDSVNLFVTGFYNSGLHNNQSLLQKKDAVTETFFGINMSYNFAGLKVGITWSEGRYSLPLLFNTDTPENIHGFEGRINGIFSVYYHSIIRKILLFGEVSSDYSLNIAAIQGLTLKGSDRLLINIICRDYFPGFISFHGKGPRSSTDGCEYGILGNFTFEAAKYLFISAGCDISWFPWLKYRTSYPSSARRQEIRLRFIPGENLIIETSYNYRYSMYNLNYERGAAGISEMTARTLKGVIRYSPGENLTLITRIDYKTTGAQSGRGILMYQDINYRFRQLPLAIWFRQALFSTDTWDSRIYTYENDLLYNFSIPALSGNGNRTYLMVEWRINDLAVFRIKYGITTYIKGGNVPEDKDEIKMQFRILF